MSRPLHLTFIFSIFCTLLIAQAPQISSISPASQMITAATDAPIVIDFDQTLDPSTVNADNVKVFGRWSGPAPGTFTLENNDQRIVFQPNEAFMAGEWITVNLTKNIKSAGGENMALGYTSYYWTATAPGVLEQDFVEEIELRENGEGLLQTYGAYARDLNNDGYSDLTIVNETSDDLRILLNDGEGNYGDFTTIPMGNMTPSPNEGADFNNDGEIDLAVSTANDNEVRILIGDGQGGFSSQTNYTTGNGARGLVVMDCNGDGHDDIFIANRLSDDLNLLTNNGDGTFVVSDMDTDGDGETAAAVSDINNDGIPDVFVGMYNSRELAILIGDGEGGFTLTDRIDVQGRPWMIGAGDLNGDGNADVVSANSTAHACVVAFGDGTGQFSSFQHYFPENSSFPLAVDLGDLDGDGDLDVVTSNYQSATYTVYENDGNGGLTVADLLNAPNLSSCAIIHDRDNDGDLDLVLTDEGDDVVHIYDNPGIVDAVNELPSSIASINTFPNPFSDQLNIEYELAEASQVQLQIFNLQGQQLLNLGNEYQLAGMQRSVWNGKNSLGQKLPSGTYLLKITTEKGAASQKITIQ